MRRPLHLRKTERATQVPPLQANEARSYERASSSNSLRETASQLHRSIDRVPLREHFAADRADDGDAGDDDQAHDQSVFENFAALFITDQLCEHCLHSDLHLASRIADASKEIIGRWPDSLETRTRDLPSAPP